MKGAINLGVLTPRYNSYKLLIKWKVSKRFGFTIQSNHESDIRKAPGVYRPYALSPYAFTISNGRLLWLILYTSIF